jgi:NADH-quinone oxidoreductase subunit N
VTPPLPPPVADALAGAVRLVVPEVALVGTACVLFTMAAFSPKRSAAFLVALVGAVTALALAYQYGPKEAAFVGADRSLLVHSTIDPTGPAGFVRWLSLLGLVVFLFTTATEAPRAKCAEYFGCLTVITAGVSLVGRANDLVTLYLALEMISIPTYVLLYLPATTNFGREAAVKYFLLSLLASAVLLFGLGYLFGAAGTTNLTAMATILGKGGVAAAPPLAVVGAVLAVAGLAFRLAAVPFHFYAPDVYEGGPTGVVSVLAVIPKVAGVAALARVLGFVGPTYADLPFDAGTLVPFALGILAAVSMTFGNVMALLQDNLKRTFAYSGIAHAGYLLIGLSAAGAGRGGIDAVYFYLAAYALMTAGAFAAVRAVHATDRPVESVDDLAGLAASRPLVAACLAVSLVSMIGLPLTAGFPGKLQLFLAAFAAPADTPLGFGFRTLAFVGAANAAIGAVYYLRMLGAMYLRTPLTPFASGGGVRAGLAALVCATGTLAFGIYPKPLAEAATSAAPVPAPAAVK